MVKKMAKTKNDDFVKSLIGKSPYEILVNIRAYKGKSDEGLIYKALHENTAFADYCAQQLHAFLQNNLALTDKDAQAIDVWWKYSANSFEPEKLKLALEKIDKGLFISADKFIDMEKDPAFLMFVNNIPDIKEELNLPKVEGAEHAQLNRRQEIVDFVRFMQNSKKASKLIETGKWPAIQQEFDKFPKMPIELIAKLYDRVFDYNEKNPQKPQREKETFLTRILFYRLDNICSGAWKPNAEEIAFLQSYLKGLKLDQGNLIQNTLDKLEILQQEKQPEKNEISTEQPTLTVNEIVIDESAKKEKPENIVAPKEQKEEIVAPKKQKEPPVEQTTQKQDTPVQENIAWKDNILAFWQEWSKKNNKIVQEYKPADEQTVLAFKVYENQEKAQKNEFDADISYTGENNAVVKGYQGKAPSDAVFAALVAQAKKNGQEICFGDIKTDIFKAKLWLACLNEKDVKIVNPPKLSELTDLPEDLRTQLAEKLPRPASHAKERMNDLKQQKLNPDGKKTERRAQKPRSGSNRPSAPNGSALRRKDGKEM